MVEGSAASTLLAKKFKGAMAISGLLSTKLLDRKARSAHRSFRPEAALRFVA
jgi:hypothetical protein